MNYEFVAAKPVETRTEQIDPELARDYLQKNYCNRTLSIAHRDKLARAMLAGEFHHTHQGIAFDLSDRLIDGQHRLSAIIQSKTTQLMQVTRNIPVPGRSMIDNQSRPRSVRDALAMEGHRLADKQAVAICRMWMHLKGDRSPAVHEIREFLNDHEEAIVFACKTAASDAALKHACIGTMLAVAYEAGHGAEIMKWAEVIRTGLASQEWQSSATRFRDWWMTNSHNGGSTQRVEICQRVFTSMVAWVEKRGLSKLYAKQVIDWIDLKQG